MGINKSGQTDPSMMIRGGRVDTHDGHLVIEGDTFQVTDHIQPQGLTHPPATTTSTALAIPDTAELDAPRELLTYETATIPRQIRELLFEDGYIIHVGMTLAGGLAVYTVLRIYWWWLAVRQVVWHAIVTTATDVGIAVLVIAAIAAVARIRGGGSGSGGPIDFKACPRGPLGPGRWRIWND